MDFTLRYGHRPFSISPCSVPAGGSSSVLALWSNSVGGTVAPPWIIDFTHTGFGLHFSGCSFRRPGWAPVSTCDRDPSAYTWMTIGFSQLS